MDITHSNSVAAALSTPKEISAVAERFTNYFYGSIGLAPKTIELNVSIMRRWARELGVDPTKRNGVQLATQDVRKIVRVVAKRAGITKRVHPHLFRHSLATNLLHRGAGLLSIQRQLGHRYLATTLAYLHTNTDRLQNDYRQYCPSYV